MSHVELQSVDHTLRRRRNWHRQTIVFILICHQPQNSKSICPPCILIVGFHLRHVGVEARQISAEPKNVGFSWPWRQVGCAILAVTADFGQTDFGQPSLASVSVLVVWPTLAKTDFGPKPTLAKTDFGQTDFGQTDFGETDFGQTEFDLCAVWRGCWFHGFMVWGFTCGCWFQGFGSVMFGAPGTALPWTTLPMRSNVRVWSWGWGPKGWGPKGRGLKGWGLKGWGPEGVGPEGCTRAVV